MRMGAYTLSFSASVSQINKIPPLFEIFKKDSRKMALKDVYFGAKQIEIHT